MNWNLEGLYEMLNDQRLSDEYRRIFKEACKKAGVELGDEQKKRMDQLD